MLSLSSSQCEPSALLSNARLTIATLIQRPSTVTTSNAFEEFAILDHLIDVSNDVDRFEGGESRKFLNIAQLITASTCIYSRRVDALYKLINTFQSTAAPQEQSEKSSSDEDDDDDDDNLVEPVAQPEQKRAQPVKSSSPEEKKKKNNQESNRSFLCHDLSKISLNPSKAFFLDRTAMFDLKLFQKHVPVGNKQFWINDNHPMIFDLLFDNELPEIKTEPIDRDDEPQPHRLADALHHLPPAATFDVDDIPLPLPTDADDQEPLWGDDSRIVDRAVHWRKPTRSRTKRAKPDVDLNVFRQGLNQYQQALFRCQKFKPVSHKPKIEREQYFNKKFHRKHFDSLVKGRPCPPAPPSLPVSIPDWSPSLVSIFVYPTIVIRHFTIREQYALKMDQPSYRPIRSPPMTIADVLDANALVPLSPLPGFTHEDNEDVHEDFDVRLQTDMEQFLDAAMCHSNEEQEHNKAFLALRSTIVTYMNEHESVPTVDAHDLVQSLKDQYSLPLVFSQLLHLCAATQRYQLRSTADDNLLIGKVDLVETNS